jgi:hypothetical protein
VPALDLLDAVDGKGIFRYYDKESKELVLRLAPIGAELNFIRGGDVRQTSSRTLSQSQPQSQQQPRSLALDPLDEIEQQYQQPQYQPSPQRQHQSTVLSDERLAELEQQREKERLSRQAERIVLDFPEAPTSRPRPAPGLRTRSSPLRQEQPVTPMVNQVLGEQFLKR